MATISMPDRDALSPVRFGLPSLRRPKRTAWMPVAGAPATRPVPAGFVGRFTRRGQGRGIVEVVFALATLPADGALPPF